MRKKKENLNLLEYNMDDDMDLDEIEMSLYIREDKMKNRGEKRD